MDDELEKPGQRRQKPTLSYDHTDDLIMTCTLQHSWPRAEKWIRICQLLGFAYQWLLIAFSSQDPRVVIPHCCPGIFFNSCALHVLM
jgi:hypothetical protein